MRTRSDERIPSGFVRPTAAAAASIGIVAFPGFVLGAFGPSVKDDLGIGDTAFGALFTIGFFVSAVALQVGGPFADLGPRRAVRTGLTVAMLGSAVIALFADGYLVLVLGFGVARVAEAIVQPATNTFIAGTIVPQRRGLAMGLKQSAVPVVTSAAGLAVPVLGGLIGWRGVFGLIALCALPVAWWLPAARTPEPRRAASRNDIWRISHLRLAAAAGGLAAGAVITVASFLTTAAVDDAGFSAGRAGLLLTMGGVIMTVSRVSLGALADRRSFDRFRFVGLLLVVGALAFPLFATGTKPGLVIGTLIVFGVGWSFPGLLLLGVIEQHPEAPGAATAVVQTGVRVGAMVSPLVFGIIVDSANFATAWMLPLLFMVLGAAMMLATSLAVRRRTDGQPLR